LPLKPQPKILEAGLNTTNVVDWVGSHLGWKGTTNEDSKARKMNEEGTPSDELENM